MRTGIRQIKEQQEIYHAQQLFRQGNLLLKAAGFRIPQDISVVTYMRKEISEFCDPPLTTLEFDFNGIGESACEIMAVRLQGKPCPVKHICVPTCL